MLPAHHTVQIGAYSTAKSETCLLLCRCVCWMLAPVVCTRSCPTALLDAYDASLSIEYFCMLLCRCLCWMRPASKPNAPDGSLCTHVRVFLLLFLRCVCWMLAPAVCIRSCPTALLEANDASMSIDWFLWPAAVQVCVLDAGTGGVYQKLPHSRDWPLAPAADTYPGACDGMLR